MNSSNIKNFLIVLFLGINIYLLGSLIISADFRIDSEAVDSAVSVLKNNGISVSKDIIPTEAKSLKNVDTQNIIYKSDFYSGSEYKNFHINGDSFAYSGKADDLYSKSDKAIRREVKKFFGKVGFDTSFMQFSDISDNGGTKKFDIYCSVHGYKFFDSVIHVSVTEKGFSAKGKWYEPQSKSINSNSRIRNTVYATGVLVEMIENKEIMSNVPFKVTNIELGFLSGTLYGKSGHVAATGLPYYRITTDSGRQYYFDASDGSYDPSLDDINK